MHRAKGKQDLDIVTEHYQAVIKNLQVDRENVQRERDAAILRYQQQVVLFCFNKISTVDRVISGFFKTVVVFKER